MWRETETNKHAHLLPGKIYEIEPVEKPLTS
jgi:hypothetical protein